MRELSIELPRPRLRLARCPCHRDADLVGPLISRVRDQAYDLTVHVRSPLPSHLPLPNPRISNRPAVRSVVETFGDSSVSLPGPSRSYFGCFLHLIESASTSARRCIPVGSTRTRVRVAAKRHADELVGSVVSDARGLGPRHAPPLHALLSQRYGASTHIFVRALARPPTAYDPGDRSSCFPPAASFACVPTRALGSKRATDLHRHCR